MDDIVLYGFLILVTILFVIIVLLLIFRKPGDLSNVSLSLQSLNQILQQQQTSDAVLTEKMTTLGASANAIRTELSSAKTDITKIQAHIDARQLREEQTAESIRRLEAIIAGTQSKGSAGENIIEVVFAKLPPEWQVRNFKVGNKSVEFAIRLPNNLILPIDSKWAATNLIEQFRDCEDIIEQQKLKGQIELAIMNKAKEVKKYIDPNITVNFGIAAVPDAVYDLSYGIQVDICQMNVVLISYSMFIPYLLLVYHTMLKSSQNIDIQKLTAHIQNVQQNIEALQKELDGRFSDAITRLTNSKRDMAGHISKLNSSLSFIQICTESQVHEIPASTEIHNLESDVTEGRNDE